ncbi:hypothetical protein ACFQ6V_09145 [Streptomyces roseifaciens]
MKINRHVEIHGSITNSQLVFHAGRVQQLQGTQPPQLNTRLKALDTLLDDLPYRALSRYGQKRLTAMARALRKEIISGIALTQQERNAHVDGILTELSRLPGDDNELAIGIRNAYLTPDQGAERE